jgi:TfoX/Sxy family transcriptional regulator of competence genes
VSRVRGPGLGATPAVGAPFHTADMAYDEQLAARIREAVAGAEALSEKRMFGGLAFLVHGNMAVAASGQGGMMLRVDPQESETLTQHEHVRRMVMRGREMDGWLRIDDVALRSDQELQRWVDIGVAYAESLPGK